VLAYIDATAGYDEDIFLSHSICASLSLLNENIPFRRLMDPVLCNWRRLLF
jgi:hypothetical protein